MLEILIFILVLCAVLFFIYLAMALYEQKYEEERIRWNNLFINYTQIPEGKHYSYEETEKMIEDMQTELEEIIETMEILIDKEDRKNAGRL